MSYRSEDCASRGSRPTLTNGAREGCSGDIDALPLLLFGVFFAVMGFVVIGLMIFRFNDDATLVLAMFMEFSLLGISALFLAVYRLSIRRHDGRGAGE